MPDSGLPLSRVPGDAPRTPRPRPRVSVVVMAPIGGWSSSGRPWGASVQNDKARRRARRCPWSGARPSRAPAPSEVEERYFLTTSPVTRSSSVVRGHDAPVLRAVLEVDQEARPVGEERDARELGLAVLQRHDADAAVRQRVRIPPVRKARPHLVVREGWVLGRRRRVHLHVQDACPRLERDVVRHAQPAGCRSRTA